jgi:hypothetical protein
LSPASNFTLELDRPSTLTPSIEVAIVIGLRPCGNTTCAPISDKGVGDILYNGPYHPQYDDPSDGKPPHQNFTLTVPQYTVSGGALLTVSHFAIVGVSTRPCTTMLD